MVTETILKTILKNNMPLVTGRVRFGRIDSNNNLIKKSDSAFFLEFEIVTSMGNEYQVLYTNRNTIREFAHLGSIQIFLERLKSEIEWELEGIVKGENS